ncbi:MAG: aminopeptidase [Thermoplasmata archaeon]|nr:aminopeptidase [Thermoplasmata archaeon]
MATNGSGPEALARVLLGSSLGVKRGENVIIETWSHTLPYATACVTEARRRGASPLLLLEDEAAFWRSLETVPKAQMGRVGAHEWAAMSKAQAYVFFPGPADRARWRALPGREIRQAIAYNREWYRRAKAGHLRGVRSMLGYASDEAATTWHVDGPTWREQLVRGSTQADPATIKRDVARVSAKLRKGHEVRIMAPNGTDFSLHLRGRTPIGDDGITDATDVKSGNNMAIQPPGFVAVAVDEKSASGIAVANRPSFLTAGRVDGGQWEFEHGQVVHASFTDGGETFDKTSQEATPGWNRAGFISVGVNPALDPGTPQVEDQEAGAVAVGIGGNAGYGGSNQNPFLAWLIIGDATVALDGKPLVDRGKLL